MPVGFNGPSTIVGAVVIALAVITTIVRFIVRTVISHAGLKADDYLILFAVLCTITTAVLLLHGNAVDPDGQPWANAVPNNNAVLYHYTPGDEEFMKLSWISSLLYFCITGSTKIAILIMYNRIFSADNSFKRSTYIVGAITGLWWLGSELASILNCRPTYFIWSGDEIHTAECFNFNIFWVTTGAIEVVIDTVILLLPVKAVWRLQLTTSRKLSVIGIFLLGGFVVITSMVKTIKAYIPGSWAPSFAESEIWGTIHTGMAIVSASLPVMAPLFNRIRASSLFSKTKHSSFTPSRSRQTDSSVPRSGAGKWHALHNTKASWRSDIPPYSGLESQITTVEHDIEMREHIQGSIVKEQTFSITDETPTQSGSRT